MANKNLLIPGLALALLALAGCASQQGRGPMHGEGHGAHHHMGPPQASARLAPTQGNQASGMAIFHTLGQQTVVHVRVSGLKPNAEHGFHVHERGDCSAPDGTSAGGHFNPAGKPHGAQDGEHHAGDLPNLKTDANGNAEGRFVLNGLTAGTAEPTVIGKALVIHAQPDDYRSQPAGNSGPRIACGVIVAGPPARP